MPAASPDDETRTLALLHLAHAHAAGDITPDEYESAAGGLTAPPSPAHTTRTLGADAMPDDDKDKKKPDDMPDEPHGSKVMKSLHKGLHGVLRTTRKGLAAMDECPAKAHVGEHVAGMEKACKSLKGAHGKCYKGMDPLPDDYGDEDEVVKSEDMDGQPETPPGDATGQRPPDEDAADSMTDDEADKLMKSLSEIDSGLGLGLMTK